MNVELIPVIEIGYNNQGIKTPDKYPYWKHSEIWDRYHNECYIKAGFKDYMNPYLKGSSFYRLDEISQSNLIKLVKDHTAEMREGKYTREQSCAFFGGYVLRVDGQDKFFPQCCGELSDIVYWIKLAIGKQSYYEGHPEPQIKMKTDVILFDFTDDKDDPFQPPTIEKELQVHKSSLKQAVEKTKAELHDFAGILKQINIDENLSIESVDRLLIFNDRDYDL